ncbi:phosphate transporter [Natrinema pellirubrum DSM 15624]|uniref:Phosphate transporter n=1 Tax=Natrinema pellirubrum (strain DSM 15624 / CIP 106293 / JCM 10476 / NCIMB 786 / 157) TaxID=797303 RepID=L0JJD8_NATP1|nr:inorganic phosphate transporter [Natrinema pellirubrum]AGB31389.1 phosphate/sulfate permease [Natrinema pellirubrum DSM 15624]ELY82059.1 phosphate transporter [Natrinema pellirubrum DSM 15624]
MDPGTILLFAAAALASLFMAWVIGAGSSGATPFAPAVGANAISTMRAAFLVGILGFAGAVTQGASVSEAVGSGLVEGVTLPTAGVIVVLLLGAGLMAIGISTGYPIATAFTVTGSVIGVGFALGGDPAWGKYAEIGAVWLLTPFVGGGIAYGLASILPRPDVPEDVSVPILAGIVGTVVATLEFSFLSSVGGTLAAAGATLVPVDGVATVTAISLGFGAIAAAVVRWDVGRDQAGGLRRFLLALGSLVAFSAGASQVGLAVGPLFPLLEDLPTVSPVVVLLGGGVGILVGSWTSAPRMIKSISQEYASLGPRRSISTLVPSFLIAQTAVLLGVPVSFNEIIVSAIIGSGLAVTGGDGVSPRKLGLTVAAWVGSFGLAFGLGYGLMFLLEL